MNVQLRYLVIAPAIAIFISVCAGSCQPVYQPVSDAARLMKEKQDMADFEALQKEREVERMSDQEILKGVVYEPN